MKTASSRPDLGLLKAALDDMTADQLRAQIMGAAAAGGDEGDEDVESLGPEAGGAPDMDFDLSQLSDEELAGLAAMGQPGEAEGMEAPEEEEEGPGMMLQASAQDDVVKEAQALSQMYDFVGRVQAHGFFDELGKLAHQGEDGVKTASDLSSLGSEFVKALSIARAAALSSSK